MQVFSKPGIPLHDPKEMNLNTHHCIGHCLLSMSKTLVTSKLPFQDTSYFKITCMNDMHQHRFRKGIGIYYTEHMYIGGERFSW